MTEHILIKFATRWPYNDKKITLYDSQYKPAKGYWIKDGEPLVAADDFKEAGFGTKKCDQETGEDLKGE